MRIRTLTGIGIAAAAAAGAIAVGSAAYGADDAGAGATVTIVQDDRAGTSGFAPEDCPERGGSGGPSDRPTAAAPSDEAF